MRDRKRPRMMGAGRAAIAAVMLASIYSVSAQGRDAPVEVRPPTASEVLIERLTPAEAVSGIAETFDEAAAMQQEIVDGLVACMSAALRAEHIDRAQRSCDLATASKNVAFFKKFQAGLYGDAKAMKDVAEGFGAEQTALRRQRSSVEKMIKTIARLEDELIAKVEQVVTTIDAAGDLTQEQSTQVDRLAVELQVLQLRQAAAEEERADYDGQIGWLERNESGADEWSAVLRRWGMKLDVNIERELRLAAGAQRDIDWMVRVGEAGGVAAIFDGFSKEAGVIFRNVSDMPTRPAPRRPKTESQDIAPAPDTSASSLQILKDAIKDRGKPE